MTHYADSDLSLTQASDRFHVSESYLPYTFKIQSGVNLISFVENLRMTKEPLRQTSLKIGDSAAGGLCVHQLLLPRLQAHHRRQRALLVDPCKL